MGYFNPALSVLNRSRILVTRSRLPFTLLGQALKFPHFSFFSSIHLNTRYALCHFFKYTARPVVFR